MGIPLKLLIIEDSASDAELIVLKLEKSGYNVSYERIEDGSQMWELIKQQSWDIIISDHNLPQFDSLRALQVLKDSGLDIPFIIVSGAIGEEIAVRAMKSGARDYVSKDDLARLPAVVEREIAEAKMRSEHKLAEKELRSNQVMLARTEGITHVGSWEWDIATDTVTWSKELFRIFQRDPQEGTPSFAEHPALYHPADMARLWQCVEVAVADGTPYEIELRAIRKDGEIRFCIARGVADRVQGERPTRLFGSLQDITERKIEQEALRKERDLSKNIIDTAQAIILTLDTQGRIIHYNKYLEEISGYRLEEVQGKDWFSIFLPEKAQSKTRNLFNQAIGNIRTQGNVDKIVTRDGREEFDIEWYDKIIKDTNGNIVGLLSIGINITKRKKAEDEIFLQSQILTHLAEGVHFVRLSDHLIIYTNPRLDEMFGYDRNELIRKNVSILNAHCEQNPEEITEGIIKQLNISASWSGEIKNIKKDGTYFWCQAAVTAFEHPDYGKAAVSIHQDITKRKLIENSLRESQSQYQTLIDNANEAIVVVQDGLLKFINKMTIEILAGYSEQEITTRPFTDFIHPDDRAMVFENYKKRLKGEPLPTRYDFRILTHDGDTRYVEIGAVLIEWKGKPATLNFLTDITERRQAEAENQKLREKAEISSRLATVGEMASGIAHEINNPLTSIIGFSELLLTENLPPDIKEQVKIIAESSQRVKNIVRRLLIFARQNKPVKTSVNIHELIDSTLEIRSYVFRTANIEVIRYYDPALPWINTDPGQMQQVFLNIIVNAEYAIKKAHDKGKLIITTEKKDGHVRISFQDDGIGMGQETKEKLFNPFFTTKDEGEGTGLGLSLSRSIVLEHGGTIEVESKPDKGANFIIMLPVTPTPQEGLPETIADTTKPHEKVRAAHILVVDDEDAIRSLLSKILAQSGHTVDTTEEPEAALLKLEETSYDVLILDIRMPGMSGKELYAKITEKHPELARKVIFITGDTSDPEIRHYLDQEDLPCISKPFDCSKLLQKVQSLLQ